MDVLMALLPRILLAVTLGSAVRAQDGASAGPATFNRDFAACPTQFDSVPASKRAIICAEKFIRAQGYTQASPSVDGSSIVYEFIELEANWRAVLKGRRGELRPKAVGICDGGNWFEVIFAPQLDTGGQSGRGVRVRKDFQFVNVVHQDFRLPALKSRASGCRTL